MCVMCNVQLTWYAQTPVTVAHTAADPVGTGVQGTEVHQLAACGASEACCAATAKSQGTRALCIACTVVMTGAGGTRVHLLLTCSTLVTCEMCGSTMSGKTKQNTKLYINFLIHPRDNRGYRKTETSPVPMTVSLPAQNWGTKVFFFSNDQVKSRWFYWFSDSRPTTPAICL